MVQIRKTTSPTTHTHTHTHNLTGSNYILMQQYTEWGHWFTDVNNDFSLEKPCKIQFNCKICLLGGTNLLPENKQKCYSEKKEQNLEKLPITNCSQLTVCVYVCVCVCVCSTMLVLSASSAVWQGRFFSRMLSLHSSQHFGFFSMRSVIC